MILKPTKVIVAKLGLEPNGAVQKFFTNNCYRHMDKYVPRDDGNLRANVDIEPDHIIYKSPHAHYVYEGILYVDPKTGKGAFHNKDYGFWSRPNTTKIRSNKKLKYHTPGTGPYWDRAMVNAEIQVVIKETENYMRGK